MKTIRVRNQTMPKMAIANSDPSRLIQLKTIIPIIQIIEIIAQVISTLRSISMNHDFFTIINIHAPFSRMRNLTPVKIIPPTILIQ